MRGSTDDLFWIAMGAKENILELLKANVAKVIPRKTIVDVAKSVEWARRVRELRAEGWQIETSRQGYKLLSLKKAVSLDVAPISEKLRYAVLRRDGRCRRCGRTVGDDVRLVVDHIIPRAWGGKTEIANLWALCEDCNRGKKHFENDFDAEAMKNVLTQSSGRARVLEYLKMRVGQVVTKEELVVVSGIHDYPRRVRELRDDGWDIVSCYKDFNLSLGDYVLRSLKKRTPK